MASRANTTRKEALGEGKVIFKYAKALVNAELVFMGWICG